MHDMQEWLAPLLSQYASIAPLIVFLLLVIAAFNVPISEDLIVIMAGIFVASIAQEVPSIAGWMLVALIAGAIGGDMISYAMGRKIGRPLLQMRFFRRMLPEHRLEQLSAHFAKHAALTILLGRLIPFGVRNGISLCAGLTRLNAWKFLLLDTLSGTFSISVIYWLSLRYSQQILHDIRTVQLFLLSIFSMTLGYIVFRIWQKHKQQILRHKAERTKLALLDPKENQEKLKAQEPQNEEPKDEEPKDEEPQNEEPKRNISL